MNIGLESDLRRQIADLETKISEYEGLLYHHEPGWNSLKQSDASYQAIFENTGTGAFVKEADMTISKVNSEFERLTGYSKADIEGEMKWTDFFLEEDHDRLAGYHADRRTVTRDAPRNLECRIKDSSGAIKPVYLTLDLIPGTRKSIGTLMDITKLKQAEAQILESKAFLAAIVESFEGLIYVVSRDLKIQYLNEALLEKVGRNAVGKPCYEVLHHRAAVCPFCVQEQVFNGESVRFEIKNPENDRWYYSVNAPIHHIDRSISLLAMVTDIQARKTAEISLKKNESQLRRQNRLLRSTMTERSKFGGLVGKSQPMQEVYEQILNAAATDATVVIYGEPGTGKELVAHAIHDMSLRNREQFVPVHCGAIPENLIESEFFGYKKGAFSGAGADKQGYVDFAHKGTLFMDEIGEISPHMQVKLLRVIEGGGYTPVGGNRVKHSDIRIIAATNRDMLERMEKQMMRKDFFYRIHILPIYMPPLRNRKEDLPLLIDHFLMLYGGKKNLPPVTDRSMDRLLAHDWPGNVRELQNVMIRYCHSQKIELMETLKSPFEAPVAEDIPPAGDSVTLRSMMDAYEKKVIEAALQRNQWHRSHAARLLGIDRKTLFTKMKRHGLSR
ncbi:sigma 54-interacting transcriptional regulator [uncultured Desulfosarcina sp.]|uniref:sigma 54-interacting transcriptional regulator n=1 Tax=uncultured Desulfosarcina sp. TaxID=218289 RepID=UPI0029C6781A|nr:sigma 54-interacting transcriptional regulator [uncultured Desulfosarcina sp.]